MKIRPVGTELFHADGRTDRHDEINSSFLQFCERDLLFAGDWYVEILKSRTILGSLR